MLDLPASIPKAALFSNRLFVSLAVLSASVVAAFILFPLIEMVAQPSFQSLGEAAADGQVVRAIGLSIYTAGLAALISLIA